MLRKFWHLKTNPHLQAFAHIEVVWAMVCVLKYFTNTLRFKTLFNQKGMLHLVLMECVCM